MTAWAKDKIRNSAKVRNLTMLLAREYKNCDPSQSLIISAMPRGGSTWFSEIVSSALRRPVLWEPLHLRNVPEFADISFGWEQVIPEDATWPEAEEAFRDLFRGRIVNPWLCYMANPIDVLFAKQMIFKFCRASGILPWLTERFDFKYKPVLLLRHPFAVAASQIQHSGFAHLDHSINVPDTPFNEFYQKHKRFLSSIETKAERQVAIWCIQNAIPLHSEKHNKAWITVYYEDIVEKPREVVHRVIKEWGGDPGVLDTIAFDVPSLSTDQAQSYDDKEKQLSRWQKQFSEEDIARMARVLDYFEIDTYNAHDIRPVRA